MAYEIEFGGNGMPCRTCPECGADAIDYWDSDIEGAPSGIFSMKWECQHCGVSGRDDFALALESRSVDTATLEDAEVGDIGEMQPVWERS